MPVSVIDANVLVSAIFGGTPLQCVQRAFQYRVCYSKAIEKELLGLPLKLAHKLSNQNILRLRHQMRVLLAQGHSVMPKQKIHCCRDLKDNAYLEACLAAKADFLITGDRDLLELSPKVLYKAGLQTLHVVTPRDFLLAVR